MKVLDLVSKTTINQLISQIFKHVKRAGNVTCANALCSKKKKNALCSILITEKTTYVLRNLDPEPSVMSLTYNPGAGRVRQEDAKF